MSAPPAPVILHVDDDRDFRQSLSWLLAAEGFRVVEAATGADGLRLAQDGPDLVLLDVRLPDVSGFDVCRALRADPVTEAIPVIQISGSFVRGEDRAHGLEDGADAYLTKPVEPRELVANIRALLRVRRAEQAFRSLADNVPDVIVRFDRELRHLYVNRRVEAATGLPVEVFLGKTNRELGMPAALVAQWDHALLEVFATGRASAVEFEYKTPRGPRQVETRIVPEFSPGGLVQTVLTLNRDVTEQRRAEESLRRSEERFRRYFELGLIGMTITTPAKGILEVNDECCRILGYTRNELLAKNWVELTHPDDLAADVSHFDRLLAGAIDGYTLDKRFIRKDGRIIDTTISVRCMRCPDGSVDFVLAHLQDVTAQKRAEALLREREERYRIISELTSDYIYSTAICPDGLLRTEWVTGAFARITSYTPEEVNARGGWLAVIHPEDVARASDFGLAIAANQPGVLEYRIVTKTGDIRWLRDYARPEWDTAAGRVVRVLGAVQDVTDQRRADEALRQSNDALRAIIQASPLAIIASDVPGNVTAWNPAAERMFGWREQEVLGRPQPTVPAGQQAEFRVQRTRALRGDGLNGQEACRVRKDGTVLDVSLSTAPLYDAHGDTRGIVTVVADVTERKRAEARLSEALAELQALTAHMQSVREEERARIAREIHDELGQALTGLKFDAAWLKDHVARACPAPQAAPVIQRAEEMSAAIDATIHTVRRIAAAGRATTLFRIAQEALTNVARHAGATKVRVGVRRELGHVVLGGGQRPGGRCGTVAPGRVLRHPGHARAGGAGGRGG